MRAYLDHASTSPLRPEAAAAISSWLHGPTGDPGRVHHEAHLVRAAVEEAREQVSALLGVRPRQLVFTSGATEAANWASWAAARRRPGAPILCAEVEHSAVRDSSARVAPTIALPVDGTGRVEPGGLSDALGRARTEAGGEPAALVHCQWANHEVGTVQPVGAVVEFARSAGVPVHVDAAAAFGQVDLGLTDLGADLVSVSAHKMGGPPGIGALVIRRGLQLAPLLVGGQQERGRRGGFENVPGILGFGAAAGALAAEGGRGLAAEADRARRNTARLLETAAAVPGVSLVGDPDASGRLPHLVCLGIDGVEAEPVLLGLDRAGIAAHSGSACSSESLEPSPVLAAMGVDPSRSLRLSVGWSTTGAELAAFAERFAGVVGNLRSLRP